MNVYPRSVQGPQAFLGRGIAVRYLSYHQSPSKAILDQYRWASAPCTPSWTDRSSTLGRLLKSTGPSRLGRLEVVAPAYFFTRSRYSPVSVSTRTTVPISTKLGTLISTPVSRVAAFITLLLVSPFTAVSV